MSCKIRLVFSTQRPLNREGSLSCHTCFDKWLRFLRSPSFSCLLRQPKGIEESFEPRSSTGSGDISIKERPTLMKTSSVRRLTIEHQLHVTNLHNQKINPSNKNTCVLTGNTTISLCCSRKRIIITCLSILQHKKI